MFNSEDKQTIEVLKQILGRDDLTEEESNALRNAIGILSWTKLTEGSMRNLSEKKKRERSTEL